MSQQAKLLRYRALEEERRKWEGREQHLEEELRVTKAQGSPRVNTVTTARLATAEELSAKTSQLESSEALRRELKRERDALVRDNLELRVTCRTRYVEGTTTAVGGAARSGSPRCRTADD